MINERDFMKKLMVSDLIKQLEDTIKIHGDMPVNIDMDSILMREDDLNIYWDADMSNPHVVLNGKT